MPLKHDFFIFFIFNKLNLLLQAAIIAFTSEFIPRLVYKYGYSGDETMKGYYENFRLSYFNTSEFHADSRPNTIPEEFGTNVTECM